MSRNNPSEPVCLYDKMATSAAVEAGYPSPYISDPSISTVTIAAASVGTTIGIAVVIGVIMLFIRRRQANRHEEGIEMQLTANSVPPS
jgi:hypothetical protein